MVQPKQRSGLLGSTFASTPLKQRPASCQHCRPASLGMDAPSHLQVAPGGPYPRPDSFAIIPRTWRRQGDTSRSAACLQPRIHPQVCQTPSAERAERRSACHAHEIRQAYLQSLRICQSGGAASMNKQANVRTSQLLGTCSLCSERPSPTTRP